MSYSARDFLADQLKAAAPGFNWNAAEIDRASEFADILLKVGITDLSRLKLVPVRIVDKPFSWSDEQVTDALTFDYDGRKIGYLGEADNVRIEPVFEEDNGRFRVAWSAEGHGNVSYFLVPRPGGFAIAPVWGSSSDLPAIREALTVASVIALSIVLPAGGINAAQSLGQAILGPVVGPVSPALAGAVGQTALTTAFNGGDVESAIKTTARGFAASQAGASVGGAITDATEIEILGRVGSSATAAFINGRDVQSAVTDTLIRNAPNLVQNAQTPGYTPPRGNVMSSPFDSDFGVPAEVGPPEDYSVYDQFNEYPSAPAGAGDFTYTPLVNNLQPLSMPDILEAGGGVFEPLPNELQPIRFPEVMTPASLDPEVVELQPFNPQRGPLPPGVESPRNATDPYGTTFRDVVTNVTGAASAALALVRLYDATNPPNPVARTTTPNPDGTRNVVVALDSGVVQTRGADGTVANRRPPVGVAQTTVSGNIVMNNGDGTYTLIKPDGTKSVVAYDPALSSDTFVDKLRAVPVMAWIAGAGLLISAFR